MNDNLIDKLDAMGMLHFVIVGIRHLGNRPHLRLGHAEQAAQGDEGENDLFHRIGIF